MTNKEYNVKVYQEVLEQIRQFIDQHHLSPGDRLPSERYLAETLKAGRSSVREALRAIELLGIIETRQGEGTFLKAYQPYHSVEILSSFILRESKTKQELVELKELLEQQGTRKVMKRLKDNDWVDFKEILLDNQKSQREKHYYFFHKIFQHTENKLLLKVWQLIEDFTSSTKLINYNGPVYFQLLEAMQNGEKNNIDELIEKLYKF